LRDRADDAEHDPVPGVEEVRLRQGIDVVGAGGDELGIDAYRVADALGLDERGGLRGGVVAVHPEDDDVPGAGLVEAGDQRRLPLARGAPGGEEVHDQRLARVLAQRDGARA
jgi:hypothetical protein